MVLFPRQITDVSEFDRALVFFQGLLRPEQQWNLADEYPLAFDRSKPEQMFLKDINSELQAGLVTLERRIEIAQGQKAKALFVGSVVTHPNARLKGYQRELFHAVEEYAEKSEFDFLVLWSSQIQFYEKLGFRLGGLQATWGSANSQQLAHSQMKVQVGSTKTIPFTPSFFTSFEKRSFRVDRSFDEMKRLWEIPQMTVACTENAYALVGKGEDFHNICHEWAGPAEEVLNCFDALRKNDPTLRILSPGVVHTDDEATVIRSLEQSNFEPRLEYLGLFYAINPAFKLSGLDPQKLDYPFFIWGLDSI